MANNPSYYIKGREGVHLNALIYPTAHFCRGTLSFYVCLWKCLWKLVASSLFCNIYVQRERERG